MRVASRLVRFACRVICARACWPAVTSSGEWLAWALKIAPIALPTPGRGVQVGDAWCGPRPGRSRRPSRPRPPPAGRARSGSRTGSRRASAARSSPGCRTSSSSPGRGRGRSWLRGRSASRAPYLDGSVASTRAGLQDSRTDVGAEDMTSGAEAEARRSSPPARCRRAARRSAGGLAAGADADPHAARIVYAPGKIVPIPASIPHEAGDMVDRRIVPDLRWIAARFPIYVTDGYSGPLPERRTRRLQPLPRQGLRPLQRPRRRHRAARAASSQMRRHWAPITRLAHWAEPVQNKPRPALPLGRLRRRRRPRLRQPPPPLLEPRAGARVPARRMGRSLPRRQPRPRPAASRARRRHRATRRRRRRRAPPGGASSAAARPAASPPGAGD